MRKILWGIGLLLCSFSMQAQTTDDDINRQMEQMAKEMEKMMESFGFNDQNGMIRIDTLFFKGGAMPEMDERFFDSFDQDFSDNLLEMMERQLMPLLNDPNTLNQLDSLFRGFTFPALPDTPEDGKAGSKKKKRKVYTL